MASAPLRPVAPAARLRRAAGTAYTEVAGHPVVCRASERAVHLVSPAMAALWAALDGRTLAEAAGPGFDLGGPDGRRLVEVVRRAKALGLVEDVADGHDAPLGAVAPAAPGPHRLDLRCAVEQSGAGAVIVVDRVREERPVVVVSVVGDGYEIDGRKVAAVRLVPGDDDSRGAPRAVRALAHLVRAVEPAGAAADPAVLDALAGLAELAVQGPGPGASAPAGE